jgi:CXXX repeat peptide maturase
MSLNELNVMLSNKSISFCYYRNDVNKNKFLNKETLININRYAYENRIMINYIYPEEDLPEGYEKIISETEHKKIAPINYKEAGDNITTVIDITLNNMIDTEQKTYKKIIVKIDKENICRLSEFINLLKDKTCKIDVLMTDIEKFDKDYFEKYKIELDKISSFIIDRYGKNELLDINILTDRLKLNAMNNCMAGIDHVTIGPDGKTYLCPAFYYDRSLDIGCIGDIENIHIKDKHLLQIDNSPLCKICDAYHCKRCIYLNKKTTCEINIPSEEQCVTSHIERETSRKMRNMSDKIKEKYPENNIQELGYYDPFIIACKY